MENRTIYDPLRKKFLLRTPEEEVRQWCIQVLAQQVKVPMHMMMSEVAFKLGEKHLRADIIVYDRKAMPLMLIECKRPDVELTDSVLNQTVGYNMVLNVKFILITNGNKTFFFRREGESFAPVAELPDYNEMIVFSEC